MNEYEAKKQDRIDRYRIRAGKANAESTARFDSAYGIVEHIPPGQPILVGHHSEKRHRNALKRHDQGMRKGFELQKKAEYWDQRAEAAENNQAISSDDPEAVVKLRAKIEHLEATRERIKNDNKAFRRLKKNRNLTAAELNISEELRKLFLENTDKKHPIYRNSPWTPHESYELTNLGQNIKRLKERLAQLERLSQQETEKVQIGDTEIVYNTEENRVQVFFPGKPSREIRTELKSNGFRWSPYNGCWQRHLSQWAYTFAKEIAEGAA